MTERRHVSVPCVYRDGRVALVNQRGYQAQVRGAGWGNGEALVLRIEPEADAKKHHQLKWYYGTLLPAYQDYTGDPDGHVMFKARYLPDGVTSLAQTTYEQMADFNQRVEAFLRAELPESLALVG